MGITAQQPVAAFSPATLSLEEYRKTRQFGICLRKGCALNGKEQPITNLFTGEVPRCRNHKCRAPLVATTEEFFKTPPPPVEPEEPPLPHGEVTDAIPEVFTALRLKRRMSQKRLADHMHVPRTYASKIENGKAVPTLRSIERFATVIGVTMYSLMRILESHFLFKELCKDDLLRKDFFPMVKMLDAEKRAFILSKLALLETSPRARLIFRSGVWPT